MPQSAASLERLWTYVLVVFAVSSALVLVYPVARLGALPSLNYNEGWNAYRDRMAAEFLPLYAAPPAVAVTNYPFLSFHVVGLLGVAIGDMVLAGRLVALLSLLATASLAGAAASVIAGSRRAGAVCGLCLLLWIATVTPERRAMDDPGLLAIACGAFAILAAVKGRTSRRWLATSGAAFAIALFVKEDVVALPVSVGLDLLLARRWRSFLGWACLGTVTAAALLALTFEADGRWFLTHLLGPRAYVPANLARNIETYLLHLGAPLTIAALVLIRTAASERRRFLLILLLATNAVSIVLAAGDGVAPNIFYPPMVALALSFASAWPVRVPVGHRRALTVAILVTAFASLAPVPTLLANDLGAWRRLPQATRDARATIAVLASWPGPAICEDLLLCFRAGKPLGLDPFFVHDQVAIGRLNETAILARLDPARATAVEMEGRVEGAGARRRFTAAFMRKLLEHDRIVSRLGPHTIFEPSAGERPAVPNDPRRS